MWPKQFARTAAEEECDIVCISALLSTTMPMIGKVIEALKETGIRDKVTVMVGGAPLSQEYCDKVGADLYNPDGASAAAAAEAVLKAKK